MVARAALCGASAHIRFPYTRDPMKGIVFTEFLEMVEERHSPELADEIIDACELANDGAYTSVGTYDYREMIALVGALAERTGVDASELTRAFGQHLFGRFLAQFPAFFEDTDSAFSFLYSVESHIHVEVLKLHPDAELPSFDWQELPDGRVAMVYRSSRPFADLAEGLIQGCGEHFGETLAVRREPLADGSGARFTLERRG